MSLKSKILAFLSSEDELTQGAIEKIELSEQTLEDGAIIVADKFEEGEAIFIKGIPSEDEENPENIKLPIGEYKLEDGKVLTVEIEGEIKSIGEEEAGEEEEGAGEENSEEEEINAEEEGEEEDSVDPIEALIAYAKTLEERIAMLEGKMELSEEEVIEGKEDVNLSAEEEIKPEVHIPENKAEKKFKFYFPKSM